MLALFIRLVSLKENEEKPTVVVVIMRDVALEGARRVGHFLPLSVII